MSNTRCDGDDPMGLGAENNLEKRTAHSVGETQETCRAEAIDWANDPAQFPVRMTVRLDELPRAGTCAQRPWADTYWPTYQDGINFRWQKTGHFLHDLSPAEKYDAAFNAWDPEQVRGLRPYQAVHGSFDKPFDEAYYQRLGPLAKQLSHRYGNKRTRDAAAAGKLNPDGTAKSGVAAEDYGGLETWFGLCHAWASAAILEKEPLAPVVHNGIRFEVSDIKALLIACYNNPNSVLIGRRSNERDIVLDNRGRATKAHDRDINPGTFHICLANIIGRDRHSFCEDRTGHYEVWNQPIQEFEVMQLSEISEAQAAQLVHDTDADYDYNPSAARFCHVKLKVDYITESSASTRPNAEGDAQERSDYYEYILELDREGRILGGEWLGSSRKDHPDFLWYPQEGGQAITWQIELSKVRVLLQKSRAGGPLPLSGVNVENFAYLQKGQTRALEVFEVQSDGVLEFLSTGSGDMDVYVGVNRTPTFDPGDGRPLETDLFLYEPGSNERKTLRVKKGDQIHVIMRAYIDESQATLRIKQL